jgi:pseudouridine-5'-phosphate glycosidase
LDKTLPLYFKINQEVVEALRRNQPLVALESTVISHGLPYPENLNLALKMEQELRQKGVVPATIGVLDGLIHVGMTPDQLERLAAGKGLLKISSRDFAPAIARRMSGGTTVAGTMVAAHRAGLRIFATGGIGGVHRQPPFDISTDLLQLASTPMIVVCAGAKAILDLPATLEVLETYGIPVIGYQTGEFPAFYSRSSGLPASAQADSPAEIVAISLAHWELNQVSAVLVVNPPPEEAALPVEQAEHAIQTALQESALQGIRGQQSTPFLLQRVMELTQGASLKANLALLYNNARLAGEIARNFYSWQMHF